eukprot:253869-Chlamydomonas_euryale.AAC.1
MGKGGGRSGQASARRDKGRLASDTGWAKVVAQSRSTGWPRPHLSAPLSSARRRPTTPARSWQRVGVDFGRSEGALGDLW